MIISKKKDSVQLISEIDLCIVVLSFIHSFNSNYHLGTSLESFAFENFFASQRLECKPHTFYIVSLFLKLISITT